MKKLIAMLLALAMVLSLAACGASEPAATEAPKAEAPAATEAPATEAPAPAVEPVTLNIAYMPNWGALWAIATAEAKGYFAEEGITLNMVAFENGPTEIAAMESGSIDLSYIGHGAHKLCSTGDAEIFLLQHLGDGDCIIGLNGITKLEELKGKKIGYAAGTSSETLLNAALASVGLTTADVELYSMDETAMTTAAISGDVDAVSVWAPYSLNILANAKNATDICSNVDFASLVSPGSWVVNPEWAEKNPDLIVRFIRAMYKGMDYAAAATTDDAIANEVAGYIAKIIASDAELVLKERYTGTWKTGKEIVEMVKDGSLAKVYTDQQATFIANGVVDGATALAPADFVLSDLMLKAAE